MKRKLVEILGTFQIPKPNQEKEVKEIEKILKKEFGIEGKVIIFGYDWGYDDPEKPINYNQILVDYSLKSKNEIFKAHFNGQLSAYGITNVSFVYANV